MALSSLRDALRWFQGGDAKEEPLFKTEKEAYDFCRSIYNRTGGATDELRRAFEFYHKNYNDGCDDVVRFEQSPYISPPK